MPQAVLVIVIRPLAALKTQNSNLESMTHLFANSARLDDKGNQTRGMFGSAFVKMLRC